MIKSGESNRLIFKSRVVDDNLKKPSNVATLTRDAKNNPFDFEEKIFDSTSKKFECEFAPWKKEATRSKPVLKSNFISMNKTSKSETQVKNVNNPFKKPARKLDSYSSSDENEVYDKKKAETHIKKILENNMQKEKQTQNLKPTIEDKKNFSLKESNSNMNVNTTENIYAKFFNSKQLVSNMAKIPKKNQIETSDQSSDEYSPKNETNEIERIETNKHYNKIMNYISELKQKKESKQTENDSVYFNNNSRNKSNSGKHLNVDNMNKINSEKKNLKKKEEENEKMDSSCICLDEYSELNQAGASPIINLASKKLKNNLNQKNSVGSKESIDDIEEVENNAKSIKEKKCKRNYDYVAIEEDKKLEKEIDAVKRLSLLSDNCIYYMVLRDVNYFLDIFSGNCEHSWRHIEFKKYSKKSGNLLYSNSALSSYTIEQYTAAVKALQSIFCKRDFKYDEYIVKVLLPEALIKICMRIYQCSKDAAEEYLQKNNLKSKEETLPRDSALIVEKENKKK